MFGVNCYGDCTGCKRECYDRYNIIVDKPPYIVQYGDSYLMSHKKGNKWFTKNKNEARKFKNLSTLKRHMQYMNIEHYKIIGEV